jgi:hypothetical protein
MPGDSLSAQTHEGNPFAKVELGFGERTAGEPRLPVQFRTEAAER